MRMGRATLDRHVVMSAESGIVAQAKDKVYNAYLVAAARTGDRRALAELVERWQDRFLAHAWRVTGDGELARDMVQEAWIEILRGLDRLEDDGAFPAWALRILTRRCTKAIRRRQRRREGKAALARDPDSGAVDEPDDGAGESSDIRTVQAALAELPRPQRAALGLFYLEQMSVAEVAVALAVPAGTVKTRLMHARRRLRDILKGDDDG